MSRFRQGSKFRHVKGQVSKRELWYADVQGDVSGEANPIAVSAKFVAVAWRATGGGSVGVLPLDKPGKRQGGVPMIHAHTARVVDLHFSPFNDNLLATGSEDCSVKVWEVPDDLANGATYSTAKAQFKGHAKRVEMVKFHPVADNIVASASVDKTLRLWDINAQSEKLSGAFPDSVFSFDWNYDGSLIALTTKDKKVRVFDPRSRSVVQEGANHEGVKPSHVAWLGELDRIVTTGFSRMRERKFAVYDSRDLSKPLTTNTLDSSTGIVIPLYDNDARILYLAGKGDGNIRAYEILETAPHYSELPATISDVAQQGIAILPKRALNVMDCEVERLFKLSQDDIIPVSYEVPRKTHRTFAEDLFPLTAANVPALSADEWFSGETRRPNLMSLDPAKRGQTITSSSSSSSSSSSTSSAPAASTPAPAKEETPAPAPVSTSTPLSISVTVPANAEAEVDEDEDYYVPTTKSIVRQTKFRHLLVKPTQQSEWVTNVKVESSAADASLLKANAKYFAVPWKGSGGQVAVIPVNFKGKLPDKIGTIETGNDALAFEFHPYRDDLLYVGLDNATIRLYKVPDNDLFKQKTNHTEFDGVLRGHGRRISNLFQHPSSGDILVSTAMDLSVRLWDITALSELSAIKGGHSEQIQSVVFNYDGGVMATSAKDQRIRLWDPRTGAKIDETVGHETPKASRLAWLGNSTRILSTGFHKSSEREFMIFDTRNFSKPLTSSLIGTGSGVFEPFFDEDIGVVYLMANGDSSIKFWEVSEEAPYAHYLTESLSTRQQASVARLPKTTCDVRNVEVARFMKLSGSTVEEFSVRVPRTRTEYFQDDVYPPTRAHESILTPQQWFSGQNAQPKLVSLKPSDMTPLSEAPKVVRKMRKFETVETKQDAADLKDVVMNKFYGKMQEYKEEKEPLPQDLQQGAEEDEWSD